MVVVELVTAAGPDLPLACQAPDVVVAGGVLRRPIRPRAAALRPPAHHVADDECVPDRAVRRRFPDHLANITGGTDMSLSDQVLARIRTLVPMAVGVLVTLLATKLGVVLDETTSTGLITFATGLVSAAYYVVVKWLETKVPAFGWLLGAPKAPVYVAPTDTVRVNGVTRQDGAL